MISEIIILLLLSILLGGSLASETSVLPSTLLLAVFVVTIVLRRLRSHHRLQFVNQLKSYRRELRNGGTVVVDNSLLRYNTVLATYYVNVGALFGSFYVPSHFHIHGTSEHSAPLLYSLASLVLGWWHLPTGPLITLALVAQNLSGGEQITVGRLIDGKFSERFLDPKAQPPAPSGELNFLDSSLSEPSILEQLHKNGLFLSIKKVLASSRAGVVSRKSSGNSGPVDK